MMDWKDAKILIVDDQMVNIRLLEVILKSEGYEQLRSTTQPKEVIDLYHDYQPDLILLDLYMPVIDGFTLLNQLEDLVPSTTFLPILVLTADNTQETRHKSLMFGAKDFLTKPINATEVLLRIRNMLETRKLYRQLEEQNNLLEEKVKERTQELEWKAEQLSLSVKYKTEFLTNTSHELRTPLNTMLVLSKMLEENMEGTLTPKQVEYASAIYSSGNELLYLINDILDISKIESGKMEVEVTATLFTSIVEFAERSFRPLAESKGLDFHIKLDAGLPEDLYTDEKLLKQILQNLLSNAFKFTKKGSVLLEIKFTERLFAFMVKDSGIGIPFDSQEIIFEAFIQADGQISRNYGGTGLGLSISRNLSHCLGGVINVSSVVDEGSAFTLYLPASYI